MSPNPSPKPDVRGLLIRARKARMTPILLDPNTTRPNELLSRLKPAHKINPGRNA
jgi:hypothetical protein